MTEVRVADLLGIPWPRFIGPKGPMIYRRFPSCCHYEENRQNTIDVGNYNHRTGWTPCGDNWWLLKKKNVEHHHYSDSIPYQLYVRQGGTTKKVVNE